MINGTLVIELVIRKRFRQIFCPWKKPEQFEKILSENSNKLNKQTYTKTTDFNPSQKRKDNFSKNVVLLEWNAFSKILKANLIGS